VAQIAQQTKELNLKQLDSGDVRSNNIAGNGQLVILFAMPIASPFLRNPSILGVIPQAGLTHERHAICRGNPEVVAPVFTQGVEAMRKS